MWQVPSTAPVFQDITPSLELQLDLQAASHNLHFIFFFVGCVWAINILLGTDRPDSYDRMNQQLSAANKRKAINEKSISKHSFTIAVHAFSFKITSLHQQETSQDCYCIMKTLRQLLLCLCPRGKYSFRNEKCLSPNHHPLFSCGLEEAQTLLTLVNLLTMI